MDKEPCSFDWDWLKGKSWDELSPWQQRLIIDSQTDHLEEQDYIPNSAVTNLIELLHESGVINAADVDIELIRTRLGIEHTEDPTKIEAAIERIKTRKLLDALEHERSEQLPIMLDDVLNELEEMKGEEEYKNQIEKDIQLLELVGIDPRQLLKMYDKGKIGWDEIHCLAQDLRSPIAEDIARFHIRKNARRRITNRRPVLRSYEDMLVTIEARKLHDARRKAELSEGKDKALRRLATMFSEMKKTEIGRDELLKIQSRALQSAEGRELMHAVWETEQAMETKKTKDNPDIFIDPGEMNWDQN